MKETTLNGYRILFVTVPEGSKVIAIHFGKTLEVRSNFCEEKEVYEDENYTALPPGAWQLMGPGLASEIQEWDIPEGMVNCLPCTEFGSHGPEYFDRYQNYKCMAYKFYPYNTRSASLLSFVRAQGMEPERTVLLYEKIK